MKYVKVKDLGQIVTGNTPPTTDESNYGNFMPFIKATDIQLNSRFTYITEQSYSEKSYNKYKANLIPKGSTCVVTIGSIGKKMTQAHTDLFVNQAINAILPNKQFDKDCVYYVTRYAVLPQLKIYDSGTTSGRENISKSSFSKIRLFIEENLSIQRKIASILSAYDNLIENNAKRIKLLEQMAENLYKEWFVRFRFPGHEHVEMVNGLPKGWKAYKIKDICDINKRTVNTKNAPLTIKYLDTSSITKSSISELQEMLFKESPSRARRMVKENSIVYSTVRPNLKHFGILKCLPTNLIVSTGFAVLDCKDDIANIVYLALASDEMTSYCSSIAEGAVATYPSIKAEELGKITIILPPIEIAEKMNCKLESFFKEINFLELQSQLLTRQRDLLLPRLMNGKLEVKR